MNLTTEVCETNRIDLSLVKRNYEERVRKWNNILNLYDPTLQIAYSATHIVPKTIRIQKLIENDLDYIIENGDDYADDLENYFAPCVLSNALKERDRYFLDQYMMVLRMIYFGYCASDQSADRFLATYRADPEGAEQRLADFEQSLMQLVEDNWEISN